MTKDEALKLALEALKLWLNHKLDEDTAWEAHNAIKEALKIKDEPVAWGMEKDGVILDVICHDEHEREEGKYTIPLYTTPQRTSVKLKDDDEIPWDGVDAMSFAKAIEAKLKGKNA